MSDSLSFDELLSQIRQLPRQEQIRLFQALGLDAGRSAAEERPAPEAGAEYHCGSCGRMLPPEDLPSVCPGCGAGRDQFVLEAED